MNASTLSHAVPQVLLVAPRQPQALQLATQLGTLGCAVQHGECLDEMLTRLDRERSQVVLLDGALAMDALQQLRRCSLVPAVVLVPGGAAAERVEALECGADDALAHPVVPRELLARLRAVLRRARLQLPRERLLRFGHWTLDRLTRVLCASNGLRVPLSLAEFRLLSTFLDNPGCVLSRERLMDLARGLSVESFEHSMEMLVSRLRTKLDDDPCEPRHIHAVPGVGYLFDEIGVDPGLSMPVPSALRSAWYPQAMPR